MKSATNTTRRTARLLTTTALAPAVRPGLGAILLCGSALAALALSSPGRAQDRVIDGTDETVDGSGDGTTGTLDSPLTVNQFLIVGEVGTGTLSITNGGSVSSFDGVLGVSAASSGTVTVDGAGSSWTITRDLFIGGLGSGTLSITNGGRVSNSRGTLGYRLGTSSTVTVDGVGSIWTNSTILRVGREGAGTLVISNGGSVSSIDARIGEFVGSNGTVTVDGAGSLWNAGMLRVGQQGVGTLAITSGGSVSSSGGVIANFIGSSGAVTVDGSSSSWTNAGDLTVGGAGEATLSISNGASVSSSGGSVSNSDGLTSTVIVDGVGSRWTNSNNLVVGNRGTGMLTITNGGSVSSVDGAVANSTGSSGAVTVDGAGSSWNTSGDILVGSLGTGTLALSNGGNVSSLGAAVGTFSGSSGAVTVDGPSSSWTNSGSLNVGREGTGTLAITNGGSVSNNRGYVSRFLGSNGAVTVDGTGSRWANAGDLTVGVQSTGTLSITGGGSVSSLAGSVANSAGVTGAVTVGGADSSWINSGNLTVGHSGIGTLAIGNGGSVSSVGGSLGQSTGSSGVVTVDGTGSRWANAGDLTVGVQGIGTLSITRGGSVSSLAGSVANSAGVTGAVTVGGAGSSWINSGNLTVGHSGIGTLAISNGGHVSSGHGSLAEFNGSSGAVTIDGSGSRWTNSGVFTIGREGIGTLSITNGAEASAALLRVAEFAGSVGTVNIGAAAGEVARGAGALNTPELVFGAGTGQLVFNHTNIDYTFGAAISGAGSLDHLAGLTIITGTNTFTRATTLRGGTLMVGDGGSIAGTSGISIGQNAGDQASFIVRADNGGGTVGTLGDLTVGASGTGTLSITNGGSVSNSLGLVGNSAGSSGAVTVDGTGSRWVNSSNITIGRFGTGTLSITNGGSVSSLGGTVANFTGSSGTVTVDGVGSSWTISSTLNVGGTLSITNGGSVSNGIGSVGGAATVDGTGSSWSNSNTLEIRGTLSITNGGRVSSLDGSAARAVTVDGAGSSWTNSRDLFVGSFGTGTLAITNGGSVSNRYGVIGNSTGSSGEVTVDGSGSSWTNASDLYVGQQGTAMLSITNGAEVSAALLRVALSAGSVGKINIGAAAGQVATGAGTLNTPTIAFGAGAGSLVFNHSDTDFTLASTISGNGTIQQLAGTTTLSGVSSGFTGTTSVAGGKFLVTGTLSSSVNVTGGTLGGTGLLSGAVNIGNGGTLSAGQSPGALTMGSLALDAGSTSVFELGEAGVAGGANNDLIRVTGNLALNGGTINVVRGAGFGSGQYTLFEFGSLSGALNNLTLDPLGGGFIGNLALGGNTVLLNAASAADLVWWNGGTTSPTGMVEGGDGIWSLAGINFVNSDGTFSGPWAGNGSLAVFGGTAGTVTIAPGEVLSPSGLNFRTDGYVIVGGDAASGLLFGGPTGIDTATGIGATIAAVISGAGSLTKTGEGTLTLSGANTYTGATNVLGGTLTNGGTIAGDVLTAASFVNSGSVVGSARVDSGGSLTSTGSIAGLVTNNGTLTSTGTLSGGLVNNTGATAQIEGILTGALRNDGTLTLTGTTIGIGAVTQSATGVFDLAGNSAAIGSLTGAGLVLLGAATLTTGSDNTRTSFAGAISGSGGLTKAGSGTLVLTGTNTFTGGTAVNAGALVVNGTLASSVTVNSDGLLGGTGTIAGAVRIGNGGRLSAGQSAGTLTMGSLALDAGSTSVFELSEAGVAGGANNDLIRVTGNLALNGGTINVVRGAGFGSGQYTLFEFGSLSGALNNLTLDPLGGGFIGNLALGSNTVLLNAASAADLVWWNGVTTSPSGIVEGGDGIWSSGGANFANANGTFSGRWAGNGATAVFGGTAGTVTIAPGEVLSPSGLNFRTDGYVIVGGDAASGLLFGGPTGIDTATGVGATIAAVISGAGSLTKTGEGILTLTASNTYTGLTSVLGGTLANGGTIAGGLEVFGGAVFDNRAGATLSGAANIGAGGTLANAGTIASTVVNNGVLTSTGTLGDLDNNAGATADLSGVTGAIGNAGTIAVTGDLVAGSRIDNFGLGRFTINNGVTLQALDAVTNSGTAADAFTVNGTLETTGLFQNTALADLFVGATGTLSASGGIRNSSGGTITNAGTINGAVGNDFDFVSTGIVNGNLTNGAMAAASLSGQMNGTISNAGRVRLNGATTGIGAVSQQSGFFELSGFSTTIGSLAGGGTVLLGAGTLTLGGDNTSTTFGGVISGSGGLTKTGSGTFTLSGPNSYTGLTEVSRGTLVLDGGRLAGSVRNDANVVLGGELLGGLINNGTALLSGQIDGAIVNNARITAANGAVFVGRFTQSASGTLDLASANVGIGSVEGDGAILLGGGFLGAGSDNTSSTFAGVIAGAGGLVKAGSGTFTLTGANTYTGGTVVDAGNLTLAASGVLASRVLNRAGFTNAGTISGGVSNTGTFVTTGTVVGTLVNLGTGTTSLAGTLTGDIDNSSGIALTGTTNGIRQVQQAGNGVFDLAGFNTTIGSLAGGGTVLLGAGTLTLGGNNADTGFGGVISGSGGLIKIGSGSIVLSGVQTYSGLTEIAGGTFVLADGQLAGSVLNTASLVLGGRVLGGLTNNAVARIAGQIDGSVLNTAAITSLGDSLYLGRFTQTASGSLSVGGFNASIGSLSGEGAITLGIGVLGVGRDNTSSTFAGVIAGAGGLIKAGSGTFMLTGANTYTGGTVVDAGNLTVAAGGVLASRVLNRADVTNAGTINGGVDNIGTFVTTGTVVGTLMNRGTVAIEGMLDGEVFNSGVVVLSGTTSGIGLLAQTPGGVFDLAGFDTAIGVLTGAGNIRLGDGSLTTGIDDIASLFGGVISGSGGLTKAGSGRLVMTGASTYSGGTTISGGILQLGDGGASGSIIGPVLNNGTLVVNRSDAYTFDGRINGTGLFVQNGAGTTTLTGGNSYTGGTMVLNGRLVGNTSSLQGTIRNDAVLEFMLASDGTFSGMLQGSGRVEKTGAGQLTIRGDGSLFTGPFAVLAGGLRLDGRLDRSLVTLAQGTNLSGNGMIGGLVAQSGALVTPGTSIGMIGVAGDLTFASGSRYLAELTERGADLIAASGTARLAGALEIVNIGGAGYTFNSTFAVLQADGGISGSFDTVSFTGFSPIYRPTLRSGADGLALVLAPNRLADLAGPGVTANQAAVAARFDAAVLAGLNPQAFFSVYDSAAAELAGTLDQLSGELHPAIGRAAMRQNRLPREAVLERAAGMALADDAGGNTWGGWGKLMRSWGNVDSDSASNSGAAAQDTETEGFMVGFDGGIANDTRAFRAGVYGSYLDTRTRIDDRGSSGRIEQTGGGVYASLALGGFSLVAGAGAARFDIATDRALALPGLAGATSSASSGDMAQVFGRMGYRFDLGAASIEPFVAGDHAWIALDQTVERGGAAALSVGRQEYKAAGANAGLAAKVPLDKLRLEGEVAARFELGDRSPEALIALAVAPGQATRIASTGLNRTAYAARLGAVLPITRRIEVRLDYSGEFSRNDTEHAALAGLNIRF